MSNQQDVSPKTIAQDAFQNDAIPNFYMNGFVSGSGLSDAYLVIQANGKTRAVINMSLSTLKSLAQNLTATIQNVEQKMKQETLTLHEIQEQLSME